MHDAQQRRTPHQRNCGPCGKPAKDFTVREKAPGLRGSIRSLWKTACRAGRAGLVQFPPTGEMLAFIGPNGVRTTTIKMLTGILYPTGGQASVLGFTPWTQRRQMAYHIGSVFGQKPQLWYHLPAEDTFSLFAQIYEVPREKYRARRAFLVEAFQIGDLLQTPVRKLSLGQRMKCEIAASLLHSPEIIFLDEPTIGLDVVAKQQIRDAIRTLNEQDGTTIFLTSHDAGDIESLCKRVIVINHGGIIFDGRTSALKRRYLRRKVLDVRFAGGAGRTLRHARGDGPEAGDVRGQAGVRQPVRAGGAGGPAGHGDQAVQRHQHRRPAHGRDHPADLSGE
ncbi:MAG: ATP-binding cassette domain-containing protein [Caldilineaceae bacterium]